MLLVYYRDKDGAIVRHHPAPEGVKMEQFQENVKAYNFEEARKENGKTAYLEVVEDGTLLAYMVKKAAERRKLDKEAVQDAISSIEDALDTVRGLEGWT